MPTSAGFLVVPLPYLDARQLVHLAALAQVLNLTDKQRELFATWLKANPPVRDRAARFCMSPDALYDAIHKRLDEEFVKFPAAAADRDALYHQLLVYFAEHGALPEFTLEKIVK
jgi:hypothetical protein